MTPADWRTFMSKNKHMTLDDRYAIEHGLNDRQSFKKIAENIGKDCTTISKEVRTHLLFRKDCAPYRHFNDCLKRRNCPHNGDICIECSRKRRQKCSTCGSCAKNCPDYVKEDCPRLAKPPYVCNGCSEKRSCTLEKRLYEAVSAQKEYIAVRSESRSGINLTEEELKQLDSVISPLLKNGQSLHHILVNNPDAVMCCEKTAYAYANMGLFEARNIDMPRKVRFRPRKQKSVGLKVDKSCRIGRTYDDFKKYTAEHPDLQVVELDSVEGKKGGAVLLTVFFRFPKFQLAFRRESNDSRSVTDIFNDLHEKLGKDSFRKLFPVILADNGSEFSDPTALEYGPDGEQRCRVFYCDPGKPYQKGGCENNHEFIRKVIPKGVDITRYSQEQIRLMMNHINSYCRPEIGNKTPYEMMRFCYGDEPLRAFGSELVPPNDIVLKPSLLKS